MHDFLSLEVADVRHETPDAIVATFVVPPQAREAFRFRPGQHLPIRTSIGGEEIRRTYSICSGPDDERLSIAIKRIGGGAFSTWANAHLKAGMTLESMPPQGRFILADPPGDHRHILGFAAGAGITPIVAMVEHALLRQPGVRFTLVYGNRDIDSIIFRQRLEDLKDRYIDRFTLLHVLSRNEESDTPLLEGRITAEKVAALARHVFRPDDVDHAYICGPGSMIREVRNALFALGLPRECVHHEFFAAGASAHRAPVPAAAASGGSDATSALTDSSSEDGSSPARIVAILDGTRHRFEARAGERIVDAALRAGIRAPYACKGGMCSTCRAQVVEGKAVMAVNYSLEPWELAKGFVLTCQAVAGTPEVVVDFDQM